MADTSEKARRPRTGPLFFGLLLLGLGATAAMAAQTGLSLVQSASIWVLVCSALMLSFLIDRARNRAPTRARSES